MQNYPACRVRTETPVDNINYQGLQDILSF